MKLVRDSIFKTAQWIVIAAVCLCEIQGNLLDMLERFSDHSSGSPSLITRKTQLKAYDLFVIPESLHTVVNVKLSQHVQI